MQSDVIPLHFQSARALARAIRAGERSSVEVTRYFLDRIAAGAELGAFSDVFEQRAMQQAADADRRLAEGRVGSPLHGVPIALKDSVQIAGTVTTAGSLTRRTCVSTRSSTVVDTLGRAGMVILGKTRMTEYAFGLSGQNPTIGTPRNPWRPDAAYAPGGSSSGSGVCVAAGLAPIALGGDTGGSIRAPAVLNGVVGYKPSSGIVGRGHCVPLSDTLDVLGPICRDVEDAYAITAILAGADGYDAQTTQPGLPQPADWQRPLHEPAFTCLLLDPSAWPGDLAPEVMGRWEQTVAQLSQAGLPLRTWSPPQGFDLLAFSQDNSTLLGYEGYQHYGKLAQDRSQPLWEVVRERILNGGKVTPQAYHEVVARRHQVMAQFASLVAPGEVVLMPASRCGARALDEADAAHAHLGDWLRSANFLGAAALTLPCGFDAEAMPVGVQVMVPAGRDLALLAAARRIEAVLGPLPRHPAIAAQDQPRAADPCSSQRV